MKRLLKALLTAVGLVLVALAVGVIFLRGPLKDACEAHIEQSLTRAMGSATTLDGVSFVPWRQEIVLRGLSVANPDGFREGTAMRFERVVVKMDAETLLSETPEIDSAVLEGGHITLRYEVGKGTNLQRLAENASKAPDPSVGNEGSDGMLEMPNQFIVRELAVEKAEVKLSTNLIPLSAVKLDLVSFSMEDVSKDKPVSTAGLTVLLLRSLLREIVTLKGILSPVADAVGKEVSGWFGEEDGESKRE